MPHKANAIVSRTPKDGKRQWKIEEVELPSLGDHEVLVEMVASGICHTDLGCGSFPDGVGFPVPPYPRVLGHEGAGRVREVGAKVANVKPNDRVLLSFSFCGKCHNCKHGAPGYCTEFTQLNFCGDEKAFKHSRNKDDGFIGGSFFGQSSFSRLTRAQETSVVNVSELVKTDEELKLFAPLGCGIQTGAGTITEIGAATTADKVAIIGLGGVGLAAIMAAKLKGCRTIIGIDRIPARIELAKSLGATQGIDTSTLSATLDKAVREMTDGSGSTITVDATGVVPLIQQGVEFAANQGKMILLGVAPMEAGLEIALVSFMVSGKQLLGSMEGGVRPKDYIPQMIQWYRQGKFPLEKLVKYYKVGEFEKAIQDMEEGSTIKPILVW